MDWLTDFIHMILHLDEHLRQWVQDYGTVTYFLLFLIVFCETGLVVTPFLPGDSLLFAAGAIAGDGSLQVGTLMAVFIAAALCGDNVNYWIGRTLGPRVFQRDDSRWLRRKHLDRTHAFFEKYGGRAIIIARFVPIVRTFTPFVAGVGRMTYSRFLAFSIAGAVIWVGLLVMAGYWFGSMAIVKDNFSLVILAIIVISILPAVIEFARSRRPAQSTS